MSPVNFIHQQRTGKTFGCRTAILFIVLFVNFISAANPLFTLTVTPTDETCLGNGTLTFSVPDAAPNASILYQIYEHPNLTTPIAVQSSNFLGGRFAGTYRVVAEHTGNGVTTTEFVDAVINNAITPFAYEVSSTPAICGNDGVITVNILSGTGAQYEIISGPETRPLQSSPVFTGLAPGVYLIRAFDDCGNGPVQTHTLISNPVDLEISNVSFPSMELPSCNEIVVANSIQATPNDDIPFPLTINYIVYPPNNGAPLNFSQTVSGSGGVYEAAQIIPFYYDQPYSYDITVIDGCGRVWSKPNNAVHQKLGLMIMPELVECGEYKLTLAASNYVAPITVQIISAPAGFNPTQLNSAHPGPFNTGNITYGGAGSPVPLGDYHIRITDACGHTAEGQTTITDLPIEPVVNISPYPGCQSNISTVEIEVPGYVIVSAVVTIAPSSYPHPLPHDVSAFINEDGIVVLDPLSEGHYVVHLIDECDKEYDADFDVPPVATSAIFSGWPDCASGQASIRVSGSNTMLTSVIVTAAPSGFPHPIPFNGTSYINDGVFSMNEIPPGSYSFTVTDNCGQTNVLPDNIAVGYSETSSNFELIAHCGAFDLLVEHQSNGVSQSFWLQEYDPLTNTWGHPDTGVVYPDGTWPNVQNSFPLQNNFTTLNLTFLGTFRIIKRSESFPDGNSGQDQNNCIETMYEFEFDGEFEIIGFQKVTCDGAVADVKVLTNGAPPLTYKITHKDGVPFVIDNGTNNIFTGLEQAIYSFEVQQYCGDIATADSDVAQLPSLAQATQPEDIIICDDAANDGVEEFDLTVVNPELLNGQAASDYTITYYSSLAEAEAGQNQLPSTITSGSKTIFVRMEYNNNDTCVDITSFDLVVRPFPLAAIDTVYGICPGETVTLMGGDEFDSYTWSTGAMTQNITVSAPGQYSLLVTKDYGDIICSANVIIEVLPSLPPTIEHIDTDDWTDNDNSITILLENASGNYYYSLDNIHFQPDNTFHDLLPGFYTVYVRDEGSCGTIMQDVALLNYPKFFTPNGDGYNEFWKVKFSEAEPNLMTYIFDRYGKLITGFRIDSPGWDGKLNGRLLPSTDYWFVVVREDGKSYRGHFAMKR